MKIAIILGIVFALAWASWAGAAPFVACDPYTTGTIPDKFKVTMDGGTEVASAPVANALKYDVGSISVGPHSVSVKACKTDPVWGEACSTPAVFSFTRPAQTLAAPSGITLVP